MDGAWSAAAVRRAEAQLMAHVPPGTLMQRAAAGLAMAATAARPAGSTPTRVPERIVRPRSKDIVATGVAAATRRLSGRSPR